MNNQLINNKYINDILKRYGIESNDDRIVIVFINIGHITHGDDSPITGDINVSTYDYEQREENSAWCEQ